MSNAPDGRSYEDLTQIQREAIARRKIEQWKRWGGIVARKRPRKYIDERPGLSWWIAHLTARARGGGYHVFYDDLRTNQSLCRRVTIDQCIEPSSRPLRKDCCRVCQSTRAWRGLPPGRPDQDTTTHREIDPI